jgi:hypothetical protein
VSDSFDPFDPVKAAMGAMHQGNVLAAEQAKVKALVYAGNELARVLEDVTNSPICELDAIGKAVCIATIAKWKQARVNG